MIASRTTGKAPAIRRCIGRAPHALSLAAAPVLAAMAAVTAGGPGALCASMSSPLEGMTAMYLLMAAFHLSPWLKLAAR